MNEEVEYKKAYAQVQAIGKRLMGKPEDKSCRAAIPLDSLAQAKQFEKLITQLFPRIKVDSIDALWSGQFRIELSRKGLGN